MRKNFFARLFLLTVFACGSALPHAARAATFFVTTSGVDDGSRDGISQPWRTLGYAVKRITTTVNGGLDGGGSTIQLGDGDFPEVTHTVTEYVGKPYQRTVVRADLIKIPSNITIQGNGSHRTRVTAVVPPLAISDMLNFQTENFIMKGYGVSNVTIRGLAFDGLARQTWGAVAIYGTQITVRSVRFSNFQYTGMFVFENSDGYSVNGGKANGTPSKDVLIQSCTFADNAYGDLNGCSGNLELSSTTNSVLRDLFITESREAYGIKHHRASYTNNLPSVETAATYRNMTIDVPYYGAWEYDKVHHYKAPDFTVEFWNTKADSVSLSYSTLTNGVSTNYNSGAALNFDIFGNLFIGGGYPIELKGGNQHIHHNVFHGSSWGIDTNDPTSRVSNLTLDHNLFHGMGGVLGQQVLHINNGGDNNVISSNTMILTNGATKTATLMQVGPNQKSPAVPVVLSSNWIIQNNIIKNGAATLPATIPDYFISFGTNARLDNLTLGPNLYWGIAKPAAGTQIGFSATTAGGDTGPVADPLFFGSGDYPDPFYRAAAPEAAGMGAYTDDLAVVGNKSHCVMLKAVAAADTANPNSGLVSMNGDDSGYLVINRLTTTDSPGNWERLGIYYNADKSVSLCTTSAWGDSGNFVSVLQSGFVGRLQADSPAVSGLAQEFALVKNGDGTISFRSKLNGLYVTAESGGYLSASAAAVGDTQKFEAHPLSSEDVTLPNAAPIFIKGADQTVSEDAGAQTVPFWATGISSGAAGEEGQALDFRVTCDNRALFSVLPDLAPDGTLTYTPAPDASGTATVTVTLHDNGGTASGGVDTSAPQNFLLTVLPVNDAPVLDLNAAADGVDNAATFTEDGGPVSVVSTDAASGLTVTDKDNDVLAWATITNTNPEDGGAESLAVSTDGTSISATYDAAGVLRLTGTDSLAHYQQVLRTVTYNNVSQNPHAVTRTVTFVVSDGTDSSAPATANVSVIAVNDAPTANGQTVTLVQNSTQSVTLTGNDVEGDSLTYHVVTPPAHGTLSGAAPSLIYTPNAGYVGADAFVFAANDGQADSAPAAVTLTVTPLPPGKPALSSLSPSVKTAGGPSFTLTVKGMGFVSNSLVKWNGAALVTAYVSATQLKAQVPASLTAAAGRFSVTVTNPHVASSGTKPFTVNPRPVLTSLSPSSRKAGGGAFTLAGIGTGFAANSVIKWNGLTQPTVFVSSTRLTASIPAALVKTAGTAQITVTTPHIATSGSKTFTIKP